jgi:PKD repeat protein
MNTVRLRLLSGLAAVALASSCTLQDVEPSSPTGPSTLGLSLNVTASPDILPEDGASQSVIRVVARGPNGQGVPNVPLRIDTVIGSAIVEFGHLSARNVTTNGNGEATVVYTAPLSPQRGTDFGTVVNVSVRQVGGDYGSTWPTGVSIRLVPETTVQAPGSPHANFFYTPSEPRANQQVQFDASASFDPDGVIVDYRWSYGDGDVENGKVQQHDFGSAGTYFVTLTVTDNQGNRASISKSITVLPAAS